VVLLGGRQMVLEALVLALALWLPGADSQRLRSIGSNFNNADEGYGAGPR